MDNQTTTQPDEGPEPEGTGSTPADEGTSDGGAPQIEDTEPQATGDERDEDALPDWARAELTSVRKEAARYRVAAKELRETLAAAKSPEEFEAASARVTELETELHRERLARTYQLPDFLASRITGETEEEREKDAQALAEAFNARTVPVGRGGLDPSAEESPSDPAALARLVPRGRR
ncbi:hypothetical protein [Streptomyces radicis]|uniref:DUF4355 domain-containing protein n=1 Tax=Streptomyces radicis TaxID=1750517 RepID=A0A3A9W942_9ACTN|nr:hypothetical protein [Streptomyces radicis]RKN09648.1 hypothetical protein D7319_11330 [Streptomyces radicis]